MNKTLKTNKNFKTALAITAAAGIALTSLTPAYAATNHNKTNTVAETIVQDQLIMNETWENGISTTGWKPYTGVKVQVIKDVNNAFVGDFVLQADAFGSIYNQVKLEPNTKYKMTTMVKSTESNLANHQFKISLKADPSGPDSRDIYNDRLHTTSEAEKGYREVTTEFTTNDDETNPLLVMQTFSQAYIGSIKLEKINETDPEKPKPEESKNLIENGDFSNGFQGWKPHQLEIQTSYDKEHQNYIKLYPWLSSNKPEIKLKPIQVEPNTTYELTYDYKFHSTSEYSRGMLWIGSNGYYLGEEYSPTWKKRTIKYTTGPDQKLFEMRINNYDHRSVPLSFTNVELKKIVEVNQ
ncbi:carbohydrate binding domain-containing protein [Bacillus cereus]|uniref:CBM-cenC domain-containing protein n=1 Tax=Bacillus cereus TaxID=1396 RepID=A0A9X7B9X1_BACCE|nr:carbohydrate binding domain-containing protein [Bacillus cereus]PED43134.1 hypothetical protein CON26_16060 [Bacillus cereus]PFV05005.1 hypothetical protein COK98_18940 [Bacillus cereus]